MMQPPDEPIGPDELAFLMADREPAGSVMVIDDSVTILACVEASMERDGHRVSTFADGLTAMGALARHEVDVPDLVLLDIEMPRMDGYEVARILRAKDEFTDTPIIMLTCHNGVIDKLRARMVGATGYIVKPFEMPYLRSVVRRYLRPGWR